MTDSNSFLSGKRILAVDDEIESLVIAKRNTIIVNRCTQTFMRPRINRFQHQLAGGATHKDSVPPLRSRNPDKDCVGTAVLEELRKDVLNAATVTRRTKPPLILVDGTNGDRDAYGATWCRPDKSNDYLTPNTDTLTAHGTFQHHNPAVGSFCQRTHQANNNTRTV